jgi:GT2 family glycosyltransferase
MQRISPPSAPGVRGSVVVVCYNHAKFLPACLKSLEAATFAAGTFRLILVDNASTDESCQVIREQLQRPGGDRSLGGLAVTFIASTKNLGFTGGNNLAIQLALEAGEEFVYLLNPDTEVEPSFLDEAYQLLLTDPKIAIVQSLLTLHPSVERINSTGNVIHFLGFGYSSDDGELACSPSAIDNAKPRDIAFASGAGMMFSLTAAKDFGLFSEDLFVYGEDLELSWRAHLAGWRVVLSPLSVVHHKYEHSRSMRSYSFIERNRWLVLLRNYDLRTLVALAPVFAIVETGLWIKSTRNGAWGARLRAWREILSVATLVKTIEVRRTTQAVRRVSEREATALFSSTLPKDAVGSVGMKVMDQALNAYWRMLHRSMWW